jgi:hypothetical protein
VVLSSGLVLPAFAGATEHCGESAQATHLMDGRRWAENINPSHHWLFFQS